MKTNYARRLRCLRVLRRARQKLQADDSLSICDAVTVACSELGASKRERLAVLCVAGRELAEFGADEAARMREFSQSVFGEPS